MFVQAFFKRTFLSLALLLVLGLPNFSLAAPLAKDKVGITVSPITDEFTIKPGQVISRTIRVINPNNDVVTLYPLVLDFTTDNDQGQPIFFKSSDRTTNYTLSSWIQFDREFIRIAQGEEELVKITVAAPKDAEPGGHYGAVLFSTEKPDLTGNSDAKVGVVGLVGTLFLATTPGKINEKLDIEDFHIPSIAFGPPVNTSVTFKNSGNIHQKPLGEIVIKNWSGSQSGFIELNKGKGNVLPESRRKFTDSWQFNPLTTFGFYTFVLHATYGSGPVELTATKKILIIPIWVIVLVGALIMYFAYRIWKRKRYKSSNNQPYRSTSQPVNKRILQ